MRKFYLGTIVLLGLVQLTMAKGGDEKLKNLKKLPGTEENEAAKNEAQGEDEPFKPSVNVGAIVHMFASAQQSGFGVGSTTYDNGSDGWNTGFSLYRARILVGGQLSKNGSFFMETELPSIVGTLKNDSTKNIKVAQIILDAQYEHQLGGGHMVVAGKQLVSHNRNGLQGAASLMANDFTFFQYPYNLFEGQPLENNFGRDLGVNLRGFFLDDKLEYRLGVFTGRRAFDSGKTTPRLVGRVAYNFFDAEKDYYYAGTKLGSGKTAALAIGADVQGTYYNIGGDFFLDMPAGEAGSITLNTAFTYMTGGTDHENDYSFAAMIPTQTVEFLELGYYFKSAKIQPWIRYERQNMSSKPEQIGGFASTSDFDDFNSTTIFGGGINYFYNGYGSNLRLSYTSSTRKGGNTDTGIVEDGTYGQVWLQLQFFVF